MHWHALLRWHGKQRRKPRRRHTGWPGKAHNDVRHVVPGAHHVGSWDLRQGAGPGGATTKLSRGVQGEWSQQGGHWCCSSPPRHAASERSGWRAGCGQRRRVRTSGWFCSGFPAGKRSGLMGSTGPAAGGPARSASTQLRSWGPSLGCTHAPIDKHQQDLSPAHSQHAHGAGLAGSGGPGPSEPHRTAGYCRAVGPR